MHKSKLMQRLNPNVKLDVFIWCLTQVDGILCLADILTDGTCAEATRAEAAAVMAQISSPHHTSTQHLASFLESMQDIVTALISEFK